MKAKFFNQYVSIGYDTTAQTLAYAGFEMAKNPDVMSQLQQEVDAAYDESDGKTPDYSVVQVIRFFTEFNGLGHKVQNYKDQNNFEIIFGVMIKGYLEISLKLILNFATVPNFT